MPRDNVDEEAVMKYLGCIVIIFCMISIILLIGGCEFIDKGFSKNPEVSLELIIRRD